MTAEQLTSEEYAKSKPNYLCDRTAGCLAAAKNPQYAPPALRRLMR